MMFDFSTRNVDVEKTISRVEKRSHPLCELNPRYGVNFGVGSPSTDACQGARVPSTMASYFDDGAHFTNRCSGGLFFLLGLVYFVVVSGGVGSRRKTYTNFTRRVLVGSRPSRASLALFSVNKPGVSAL